MSEVSQDIHDVFESMLKEVDLGDESRLFGRTNKEIASFEKVSGKRSIVRMKGSDVIQMRDGLLPVQVGAPRGHTSNLTEDLLIAGIQRIRDQDQARGHEFACDENKIAIAGLTVALRALNLRSQRRKEEMKNKK